MKVLYRHFALSILILSTISANAQNLLKDIWPGPTDGFPYYLTATKDYMIFRAESAANGRELWVTDGTTSGTVFLKDINVGSGNSNPYEPFAFGDKVLFSADNNINGAELWITDGTAAGTKLLKDIYPGGNWSDSRPYGFAKVGNKVVFTAQISSFQYEPMVTDGTASGTKLLKDIYPGTAGSLNDLYSRYVENNGELFFVAVNDVHGQELWKTDGTTAGTRLIKDINPGTNYGLRFENPIISYNNEVYFVADNGSGEELWKTDGTLSGTVSVKDIRPGTAGPEISEFCVANGLLFFRANDGTTGRELWVTDGTNAGTRLVKDIYPGAGNGSPNNLTELKGKVYFSAEDPNFARELWVSDGTAAGTKIFKDFYYLGNSNPGGFFNYADLLYVSVSIPNTVGRETWVIDGDSANTKILKDIWPGTASSSSGLFTAFKDLLIFQAKTPNEGVELWAYDPCSTANIDQTVNTSTDSLVSNASNVSYQWIYCGGNEEIVLKDETNPSFYPQLSGNYRVELKGEGCITSSDCFFMDKKPKIFLTPNSKIMALEDTIPNATYQWYDCDLMQNVAGATSILFEVPEEGKNRRYAIIRSLNGISDTSDCEMLIVTSIKEYAGEMSIQTFPNPFKEQFIVQLDAGGERIEYVLTDVQGKELKRFISNQNRIEMDMREYRSGIYLLKVQTASSNKILKLIKN